MRTQADRDENLALGRELERKDAELVSLRLQIKEGCEAARNFGAEVPDDEDEPKWVVAAAVVAERKRSEAEIARLRAALEIIAGSATDKLQALQARSALSNIG